ncbi:MAG: MBL fold metallo-hydrolase [Alphaproteobacteria bacterium]|nr:MBL fold metallo-hydrolase [Alphaproteobacteria bacterium]
MSPSPFNRDLSFSYGVLAEVAPGIRRIVAHNPGPFTHFGTGTYVIGRGAVAGIDAGPRDEAHVEALLKGLAGERVTHQLITHTHLDHSPGAAILKAATGAPTYGFGPHGGERPADGVVVEEDGDRDFRPDVTVGDGALIEGEGWRVTCVHTPGHTSNHLCFALEGTGDLFTGDHVMGWSTTVVSPPDGDMTAYMRSLEKVLDRGDRVLWPTHGAPVTDPAPFLRHLISHREAREAAILRAIGAGHTRIRAMVSEIYRDVDPRLHPAAARSVLAHLVKLRAEGRVRTDGPPMLESTYAL